MTPEEAVKRCEWWSLSPAGNQAFGSTSDPEVGIYFSGEEFDYERFTAPGKRKGWAIQVPRWQGKGPNKVESLLYQLVAKEIAQRQISESTEADDIESP